jgi:hypothetical protein
MIAFHAKSGIPVELACEITDDNTHELVGGFDELKVIYCVMVEGGLDAGPEIFYRSAPEGPSFNSDSTVCGEPTFSLTKIRDWAKQHPGASMDSFLETPSVQAYEAQISIELVPDSAGLIN